jgi:hypothetical protein
VKGALGADKSRTQSDPCNSSSLKAGSIESKFCHAGGNARFMFDYLTSCVNETLLEV